MMKAHEDTVVEDHLIMSIRTLVNDLNRNETLLVLLLFLYSSSQTYSFEVVIIQVVNECAVFKSYNLGSYIPMLVIALIQIGTFLLEDGDHYIITCLRCQVLVASWSLILTQLMHALHLELHCSDNKRIGFEILDNNCALQACYDF